MDCTFFFDISLVTQAKRILTLPLQQGQNPTSYNTQAVQYGLVGPSRLFQSSVYSPLLYGFLLGALSPVLMWLLHKRFPKARFDLWNSTIFFSWYCLHFKFAKNYSPRCN